MSECGVPQNMVSGGKLSNPRDGPGYKLQTFQHGLPGTVCMALISTFSAAANIRK